MLGYFFEKGSKRREAPKIYPVIYPAGIPYSYLNRIFPDTRGGVKIPYNAECDRFVQTWHQMVCVCVCSWKSFEDARLLHQSKCHLAPKNNQIFKTVCEKEKICHARKECIFSPS